MKLARNESVASGISKLVQGKKTAEVCSDIKENDAPEILSIAVSQSRKNQSNQLVDTLMTYVTNGVVIDNLHGDAQNTKDADGCIRRAIERDKRIIACIANKPRLTLVYDIVTGWLMIHPSYKVRFYIDEAQKTNDAFITHVYEKIPKVSLQRLHVTFIDAYLEGLISKPLFRKHFGGMIKKLPNRAGHDNYQFFGNLNYQNMEMENTDDFLEACNNKLITLKPDDYILMPLPYKKVSQYEDALKIVGELDVCVLIINGDGYHVFYNNGSEIQTNKYPKKNCKIKKCNQLSCSTCDTSLNNSEFNIIKKIKSMVPGKPFLLTGHGCIDRAMTYHRPELFFTKLIMMRQNVMQKSCFDTSDTWAGASVTKREDTAQMVERFVHSFKDKVTYSDEAQIFGPKDIYDGVCQLEKTSYEVSKLSGIIDKGVLENIEKGETVVMKQEADIREPMEYYYKKFRITDTYDIIGNKEIIQTFRTHIGGGAVQINTIERRLAERRFEEDIFVPKRHLVLNDLNNKKCIRAALRASLDETKDSSRIRIVYPYFVLMFNQPRCQFIWDNQTFRREEKEGLYACFAQLTTHKLSRLKNTVAAWVDDNLSGKVGWNDELYDKITSDAWDSEMMDFVPHALASLLNVTIYIYTFKFNYESSAEEVLFNTPMIISPTEIREDTRVIHIKYSDKFELLVPV